MWCVRGEVSGTGSSMTTATSSADAASVSVNALPTQPSSFSRSADTSDKPSSSQDIQQRILRFHQTRILSSPARSKFRQCLEQISSSESPQRPPTAEDMSGQESSDPSNASCDTEFRLRLEAIRRKRRQLEAYLGSEGVERPPRQLAALEDNLLDPLVSAPAWLVHVLENGVTLHLKPSSATGMLGDICEGDLGEESRFYSGYDNYTHRSHDVVAPYTRRVRVAVSKDRLINSYRKLGYSSMALSSPIIFVAEDVSDEINNCLATPKRHVLFKTGTGCNANSASETTLAPVEVVQGTVLPVPPQQPPPQRLSQQLQGNGEGVSEKRQEMLTSYDNRFTGHLSPNQTSEERLGRSAHSIFTHSASVTECTPARVVISGTFPTIQWGHLPFHLVMTPCKGRGPQDIKGRFTRKSCSYSFPLRWQLPRSCAK